MSTNRDPAAVIVDFPGKVEGEQQETVRFCDTILGIVADEEKNGDQVVASLKRRKLLGYDQNAYRRFLVALRLMLTAARLQQESVSMMKSLKLDPSTSK